MKPFLSVYLVTKDRHYKFSFLQVLKCYPYVWVKLVCFLPNLWTSNTLGSPLHQAQGVQGDSGQISCAIGAPEITAVWFGFAAAEEMPLCEEMFLTEDDCLVDMPYEKTGLCNQYGVNHLTQL